MAREMEDTFHHLNPSFSSIADVSGFVWFATVDASACCKMLLDRNEQRELSSDMKSWIIMKVIEELDKVDLIWLSHGKFGALDAFEAPDPPKGVETSIRDGSLSPTTHPRHQHRMAETLTREEPANSNST